MKRLIFAFLVIAMFIGSVHALSDEEKAQGVLKKTAAGLGWPDGISEDTSNKNSIGTQYFISSDGTGKDAELKGSIIVLPTDLMSGYWLDFASQQADYDRTNYMGRDAAIMTPGKNCNPKPLVKMFNDMFTGFFEGIFGPSNEEDKGCVTDTGAIIWACGKYLMIASDDRTEQGGMENDIAAAMYAAAQEDKLCEYGDTLVILAQADDKAGTKKMADIEKIAQGIDSYYAANSYGKQKFTYTFRDADGTAGSNDWYSVAPTQTANQEDAYAEAAVKKAFQGADVPQDLDFSRIVVVYSGSSKQADRANGVFSTADHWKNAGYSIEVDAANRKAKISTTDVIVVAENDPMGTWAHEFGHSLWWKYKTDGTTFKINDRYNYADARNQYGQVFAWDLMGNGNWWGKPAGSKPSQMSAYTKEAAGWLNYATMEQNKTYAEQAIEAMKAGDNVLKFDDPLSNDANFFYVVEARDSSWTYSSPETGVVLYKVEYDNANTHEIVNSIAPQNGTTTDTVDGHRYMRPTLHGVGAENDSPEYIDVPGKFKLRLVSQTSNPFTASVRMEPYDPANMVGQIMAPAGPAVSPPAGTNVGDAPDLTMAVNEEGPKPDLDLHAYDASGGHVGLNYQTGQYENTIPGAIASGDRQDSEEWIFVPAGTQVRFEVSAYKTQQYFSANPQIAQYATPQQFQSDDVKIDAQGNQVEADAGTGTVAAGQTAQTKPPDDPSLTFKPKPYPGVGSNSSCSLLPGFLALLAIGAFLRNRAD